MTNHDDFFRWALKIFSIDDEEHSAALESLDMTLPTFEVAYLFACVLDNKWIKNDATSFWVQSRVDAALFQVVFAHYFDLKQLHIKTIELYQDVTIAGERGHVVHLHNDRACEVEMDDGRVVTLDLAPDAGNPKENNDIR